MYVDLLQQPTVTNDTFTYDNYTYIGCKIDHTLPWIVEVNPHTLATAKNITNYDFALMKYIHWDDENGQKAIISDKNYYPMGWFEQHREYWTLFNKNDNERLYCVRSNGPCGIGIREIHYISIL